MSRSLRGGPLVQQQENRPDRTLGKGKRRAAWPGPAWPPRGSLPPLPCRLEGAAAGLHAAAPAAHSCLCNKCHVCILAHHPQWPAPQDRRLAPNLRVPENLPLGRPAHQAQSGRFPPLIPGEQDGRPPPTRPTYTLHHAGCRPRDPGRTPAALSSSDFEGPPGGARPRAGDAPEPARHPPSPTEEAVGPVGRRVPGPRRPVSQPVARRGRRVAAPAGLAPGPGRRRARELGGGGEGARRLRSRSAARGSRASGRARTHLHTPRSGRARAAGAPARTAADSCCSSAAARQPGARGRGGRGDRAGGEAKRGASRGSCVRACGR